MERHVLESVGAWLHAHNDVDPRLRTFDTRQRQKLKAAELSQPPLESIALDRRVAVLRNDEADSGDRAGRKNDPQIEIGRAKTFAVSHCGAKVAAARQPMPTAETGVRAGRRLRRRRTSMGAAP
jgi:hypothetical protein